MSQLEPRRRIVGAERRLIAGDLAERYAGGENIRALAASIGRSYGFAHQVLTDAGVRLRQHSGGPKAVSLPQLVATLAAWHPGELLTCRRAQATLQEVHGGCSTGRALAACKQHNGQVARSVR